MENKKMIKRVENKKKHTWFICADIETAIVKNKHIPYMYAIHGAFENKKININRYITDIKMENANILINNMIENLKEIAKKKKLIIYMHNLGGFDGIIIIDSLKKNEHELYSISTIIRNNSIYQIGLTKNIKIRDSYKIINQPLDKIGKTFINRGKNKIETKTLTNPKLIKKNIKEIQNYCNQDTEILYESLVAFNKEMAQTFNTSITEGLTISAIAFKIYRKIYYEKEIIYEAGKMNTNILKTIEESYRGGIVEVYKPFGENLKTYDINSSYPYSMKEDMPIGEPKKLTKKEIENIDINEFFGFLTAKIEVEYNYIPMIGFRDKHTLTNIYPYGKFTCNIFSEELKHAMKVNKIKIIKIINAISFEKQKIFDNYVTTIYNKRKNTKSEIKKTLYKSLLNNLYGRFGMNRELNITDHITQKQKDYLELIYDVKTITRTKKIIIATIQTDKPTSTYRINKLEIKNEGKKKLLMNIKKEIEKRKKGIITAPQISAAITAYARINIDKKKREILSRGGQIYYSDTDSIITDINIKTSEELGGWKLEKIIKKGYFLAPKIYYTIDENNNKTIKFKGVAKNALDDEQNVQKIETISKHLIKNENIDYINEIKIENEIKKNFQKMTIEKISEIRKPRFITKKRNKKYNLKGHWVDTEPIKINRRRWKR